MVHIVHMHLIGVGITELSIYELKYKHVTDNFTLIPALAMFFICIPTPDEAYSILYTKALE